MPVWGRRGTYVAATTTVVALAAIGVFAKCGRRLIPPTENNSLAGFRARFLSRAAQQGIEWRTTDQEPFAEAARLGRPVMVFAGTAASQAARRFDDQVFGNREVWARLQRDFVCVRVDLTTEPEWRSAFLPVLRNEVGADPGFTVWFFKPNGQLLTWTGRREWSDRPDFNGFLGTLATVRQQYAALGSQETTQADQEQRREVGLFRQTASRAAPDLDAFFGSLIQPRSFFQWQAGRYRALLQARLFADASLLLHRDLASPRADLIDGGVFRLGSWSDPSLVEFDKSAVANAEMAVVFARAHAASREALFEYWYRRTVGSLADQFMQGEVWSSYLENPVAEDGRSRRNSVSMADLRTRVPRAASDLAGALGLEPGDNPLMVPFLADPRLVTRDRRALDEAVRALQQSADEGAVVPGGDDTLDASAIVVARTIEAALAMGDRDTLDLALLWARRLRAFRAGTDDVVHAAFGRGLGRKWLGDFAAYADAMLMAYAATGDEEWLTDGELVLRRALELFRREGDGEFVSVAGAQARLGPLSLETPSVADNGAPPALAVFMTVCFRYGAVLGDPTLRQIAVDVAERYSSVANQAPTAFPSFLCAAQEVLLTGCVVVAHGPTLDLTALSRARPDLTMLRASPKSAEVVGKAGLRYVRAEGVPISIRSR